MLNKLYTLNAKLPLGAWLVSLACTLYIFAVNSFSAYLFLSATATALLFFKHKGAWTLSASIWIALTLLPFTADGGVKFVDAGLALLSCAALFFYLRPPYVNARSTLTGNAHRARWKGRGLITVQAGSEMTTTEVELLNISANGFSCRVPDGTKLHEKQTVNLKVPDLRNFESEAKVVSVDANSAHFQFRGWTLKSVKEHFKLRQEVREILKSRAGLTMIEMVVVAAIGSFIVLAVSKLLLNTFELESTAKKKFWIESIKSEIINGLRGRESWQQTISSAKNSSMNCVQNLTPCNPLVDNGLIEVLDAQGGRIFDSTVPTNGFNERGEFCNSFNSLSGNDACPFRYEIRWSPTCVGSCTNPEVRLDISLLYKPSKSNVRIDTQKHALLLYRSPIFDSLSANCTTLNGVFNPATGLCEWTRLSSNCSSISQVLVGFDAAGNEICEPFPAVSCPPGEFIQGFDNTGALICSPG